MPVIKGPSGTATAAAHDGPTAATHHPVSRPAAFGVHKLLSDTADSYE